MNFAEPIRYLRNLAFTLYGFILKLIINAHQLIAYWKDKARSERRVRTLSIPQTNVELTSRASSQNQSSLSSGDQDESQYSRLGITTSPTPIVKTNQSKRVKLASIFRRLSIRNFMEYCVIALNEASSSSCSNKFDISACDKPVWLLGCKYVLPEEAEKLVDDIKSKLWITYRRNFPPIDDNTRYTTDRGFGCMIRCGQMVLANALLYKTLGRNWRWCADGLDTNPDLYVKILKLFQDKDGCPYSIHNIVRIGQQEGKTIGEWFGPNTIAQALKRIATNLSSLQNRRFDDVLISVDAALDNVVVVDEIKAKFRPASSLGRHQSTTLNSSRGQDILCKQATKTDKIEHSNDQQKSEHINKPHQRINGEWMPGILFIQLRLGLSKINPLYFPALRKTFQLKNSLGIIGGRPNHALYLIGYTDDDIIYLDPHSTQLYIDLDEAHRSGGNNALADDTTATTSIDSTYHCACPEKMPIDRLDPSLALCFYFHTEQEFDEWAKVSNDLLIKTEQAPMFEITESRPSAWNVSLTSTIIKSDLGSSRICDSPEELHSPTEAVNISVCTDHDRERFTILKNNDEAIVAASKQVDNNEVDGDDAHGDDEEFEMLG